jgi:hypothetical protein
MLHSCYAANGDPASYQYFAELRGCPGLLIKAMITEDDLKLPLKAWKPGLMMVTSLHISFYGFEVC